ncbi:acetyl-CoA carboxylase biotin carboxylase subunit [Oceanobacillus manasiensis]|uniref:acetyl-CoA carboxylase biotin carboxylase subunit n=1 Tax=Oceanobacillus manasiensis TaxID=586413 RepID=UPI0005AA3271|nr:acetyl-CoA carboxylase biotin carboxylase subunit [Oceanobacillus manasiensis]
MIKKVLIANRGEIAARIIRTCKQMNITTVAVYSEADQKADFTKMADECYLIGPPRVNESYLNAEKIISIAKQAKVDAIHPGYGFLSESDQFAGKCEEAGITFIGPKASVMKQMGSKVLARQLMEKAGVPTIPGTKEALATAEEALNAAQDIGYPIMLKASAGGGGIGMQVVENDEELVRAFESNAKRAKTFFGNGDMFLEKKLKNARHIEVQILADHNGNVIHLFERDCSIQRRNQKVVEEAPSTFISEETRRRMTEAAINAAKALEYTNAGTIEFLVDNKENFYFLEMNTRVQVEHPVSEEITGIDIVEKQIKIAAGESLDISQKDIYTNGHAIEVRIYAEDPVTFMPSPGHVSQITFPNEDYARNEPAITGPSDITHFYDPMIAKLIIHGTDRQDAIAKLTKALQTYRVVGIKTNLPMLQYISEDEIFRKGNVTTAYVQEHYIPNINAK